MVAAFLICHAHAPLYCALRTHHTFTYALTLPTPSGAARCCVLARRIVRVCALAVFALWGVVSSVSGARIVVVLLVGPSWPSCHVSACVVLRVVPFDLLLNPGAFFPSSPDAA